MSQLLIKRLSYNSNVLLSWTTKNCSGRKLERMWYKVQYSSFFLSEVIKFYWISNASYLIGIGYYSFNVQCGQNWSFSFLWKLHCCCILYCANSSDVNMLFLAGLAVSWLCHHILCAEEKNDFYFCLYSFSNWFLQVCSLFKFSIFAHMWKMHLSKRRSIAYDLN